METQSPGLTWVTGFNCPCVTFSFLCTTSQEDLNEWIERGVEREETVPRQRSSKTYEESKADKRDFVSI